MSQHMFSDSDLHMMIMWGVLILLGTSLIAVVLFFARHTTGGAVSVAKLPTNQRLLSPRSSHSTEDQAELSATQHDTLFILPDISGYTRFMSGGQFAFDHAQHIVFSLINAMIDAATTRVQLSKLEGDAALFFVDADRLSAKEVGQTVMDIFGAFFQERQRLVATNICPCRACRHIEGLDLKIFVHRGRAARFAFRGAVDHFGTDVIVLHRLMKNNITGHRYVLVTEAAGPAISLTDKFESYEIEEFVDSIGNIRATVHMIDDGCAEKLAKRADNQPSSALQETSQKLGENLRSLTTLLKQKIKPSETPER